MPRGIDHVRDEHYVPLADEHRNVDSGAAWGRSAVVVESFGIFLVEINDHRILGVLVKIVRGEQESFQRGSVVCVPMYHLNIAPDVIFLLLVYGSEPLFARHGRSACVEVHRMPEISLCVGLCLRACGSCDDSESLLIKLGLRGGSRCCVYGCKSVS